MSDVIGIIFPSILCCYTCFLFYSCKKDLKNKKKIYENMKKELINLKKELQEIDKTYEKYLINTEVLFDKGNITIEDKMKLEQQRKKIYNIETYSIRLKIAIIEYELLDNDERNKRIMNNIEKITREEEEKEKRKVIQYEKDKKEYLQQVDIV